MMHIVVLGAAAGGGFPQWNANHEACQRARAGDPSARPATQASIAVSGDGTNWVLINAAPDLRQQIDTNPALWPTGGLRSSPIKAVILTNADVDAVAGLLNLREGTPFQLLAHPKVHESLDANPIFEVLNRAIVERVAVGVEERFSCCGLEIEAFTAPGKLPLYREGEVSGALNTAAEAGDTLGLVVGQAGKRMVYLANCARITQGVRERAAGADLLFMDGTLWHDREMIELGVGAKTGQRMGHISMAGGDGAMAMLADLPIARRIFIHINNTNPALLADSDARAELTARGWEVAHDGMDIQL